MAKFFFRNLRNWHFYKTYCKILHILKFETFFRKNVSIWSTCTSIDASFYPDVKYGFKFHLGQIVLSQCQIMCIFSNNLWYIMKLVEKIHIIWHCARTICPTWNLKPDLASGLRDASIEIHVDHIHLLFQKSVPKFDICRIL